jgi:hypothetical protein
MAAAQLIPMTPGIAKGPSLMSTTFPSTTSAGSVSPPATGANPQLIPTVGTANAAPIPGMTSPTTPAGSLGSVVSGATTVPTSPNATVAPVNPNETVASQLNTDLKSGSPYLDIARSAWLPSYRHCSILQG